MARNQQLGFNLLELLLVLVVASGIILLGAKRYQQYKQERDLAAISQNVSQLFLDVDKDYFERCRGEFATNGLFTPQLNSQSYSKLLVTQLADSLSDYRVSVDHLGQVTAKGAPQKSIYQLVVRVSLNVAPGAMDFYKNTLNATEQEGRNTLVWRRLPGVSLLDHQGTQDWINDGTLRYFKLHLENVDVDSEQQVACLF